MGPDTKEHMQAIHRENAAAMEALRLLMDDTQKLGEEIRKIQQELAKSKSQKRGIINAIFHGFGVTKSEIEKLIKD